MVINYHSNWVLFTPPKTGSTSCHMHFAPDPNCHVVEGPQFDNEIGPHNVCVPWLAKYRGITDWRMLIRHPYPRLVSLFGHCKRHWNYQKSFEHFVLNVVFQFRDPFYSWNLARFFDAIPKTYEINGRTVRPNISFVTPADLGVSRRDHPGEHDGMLEYDNERVCDLAQIWAIRDFDKWQWSTRFERNEKDYTRDV